jgi:hypothetical protein
MINDRARLQWAKSILRGGHCESSWPRRTRSESVSMCALLVVQRARARKVQLRNQVAACSCSLCSRSLSKFGPRLPARPSGRAGGRPTNLHEQFQACSCSDWLASATFARSLTACRCLLTLMPRPLCARCAMMIFRHRARRRECVVLLCSSIIMDAI